MAAKKKKAVRKVVRRTAKPKKKAAARRQRKQPETLRLRAIAPGFTVNDIHRSLAWYTNVLGFTMKEPWERDGKLVGGEIQAGTASLYLGQDDFAKGRDRVKGIGVRLYCSTAQDVDALAALVKSRGGVLDHEPQTQPWGTRDFGITDPDGYKLTISSL